jgi:hypothetical protein
MDISTEMELVWKSKLITRLIGGWLDICVWEIQGIRVKTKEILLLRKHKTYFLNIQSLLYSFQPNSLYRCLEQPSKHRKTKLH